MRPTARPARCLRTGTGCPPGAMPLVLPSPPAGERRRAASPGTCASHGGILARSRGPAGRPRPPRVPHPEGAGRYRAHRVPRSPRAPARQAGGRPILPRPRAPRSPSRLHLSLHGRHGDGAAAGFPPHVLGARLRGHEARARPCHLAPGAVAAGNGTGVLRLLPRGRDAHRGSPTVGAAPPARPRGPAGLHHQDRVRAGALPLPGVLRRGARRPLPRPHTGLGLPRGLPHPADFEGRGTGPRRPQPHGGGAGASRVLQGGMGPGPGGDQPPLYRGPRDGRPPRPLQARRQGNRLAAGEPPSRSWPSPT